MFMKSLLHMGSFFGGLPFKQHYTRFLKACQGSRDRNPLFGGKREGGGEPGGPEVPISPDLLMISGGASLLFRVSAIQYSHTGKEERRPVG
jgi:hypothetical protein